MQQHQYQGHVNTASAMTASAVSSPHQIPSVPSSQTAQGPNGPRLPKSISFKKWDSKTTPKAKRQTQFRSYKECGNKMQEEKCKHLSAIYYLCSLPVQM